jgi:hypothetical protein
MILVFMDWVFAMDKCRHLICQSWQQPQHGTVAPWRLHVSAIGQDGESFI